MIRRWLHRLLDAMCAPDPAPLSRLDFLDRGIEPMSKEADDLMALVTATSEDPQTVAAAAKDDGPATPLPKLRDDQLPLLQALGNLRLSSGDHQIHRDPDVPCDCCAALDYRVAGLVDGEMA